jgi:hypothetical protein
MANTTQVGEGIPEPPVSGWSPTPRVFWAILFGMCVVALVFRAAILAEGLRENPFVKRPSIDGIAYWQMAEHMAQGRWTESTPFLSAPLYPYCLGVVRTLGGGLTTVYVLQVLVHVATAGLLGWATRVRFGAAAGLLAAALFLALTEPAYSTTRILGSTLQLFLVTLLWWRWLVLAAAGFRWGRALGVGALLGLLALAFPPAMLVAPLYGLWLWWYFGHNWRSLAKGLIGLAAALVVISPATLHNLLIHGEFIPITAHGGLTLAQGNTPSAMGIVDVVPVGLDRSKMHEEAARQFEKAHGRRGSWREVDAFFRDQAIKYWLEHPRGALRLFTLKLCMYAACQSYDDGMMCIALERENGISSLAFLAPLPVPWLLGAAFVGVVACINRPGRAFPDWVLFFLPLVVVLIFFYGPRYRIVAAPPACALAAYALTHFLTWRRWRTASLVVFVLPVCLPLLVTPVVDTPAWLGERFWPAYLRQMQVVSPDATRQTDAPPMRK